MTREMKIMKNSGNAIGIFDSGVGGLTVFKEIRKTLPNENLVYLGDTARVPYGTKSAEVVRKYSESNVEFLVSKGVKFVVVACNTASSTSISYLREKFPELPVIGVINPIVEAMKREVDIDKIGVIGTRTTIGSGVYQKSIKSVIDRDVIGKACPLFVPLAEEGIVDSSITMLAIEKYLKEMREEDIDTLILACTHYPLLKRAISFYFNESVRIMDSAYYTARELKKILIDKHLLNKNTNSGQDEFFVTDAIENFKKIGEMFLGSEMNNVELI